MLGGSAKARLALGTAESNAGHEREKRRSGAWLSRARCSQGATEAQAARHVNVSRFKEQDHATRAVEDPRTQIPRDRSLGGVRREEAAPGDGNRGVVDPDPTKHVGAYSSARWNRVSQIHVRAKHFGFLVGRLTVGTVERRVRAVHAICAVQAEADWPPRYLEGSECHPLPAEIEAFTVRVRVCVVRANRDAHARRDPENALGRGRRGGNDGGND